MGGLGSIPTVARPFCPRPKRAPDAATQTARRARPGAATKALKTLTCPIAGCTHHSSGKRKGLGSHQAIFRHIYASHPKELHMADLAVCQ